MIAVLHFLGWLGGFAVFLMFAAQLAVGIWHMFPYRDRD